MNASKATLIWSVVAAMVIVILTSNFSRANGFNSFLEVLTSEEGVETIGIATGAFIGGEIGENGVGAAIGAVTGKLLTSFAYSEFQKGRSPQQLPVQSNQPASEWVNPDIQQSSLNQQPVEQLENPLDDPKVQYALERHPSGNGVELTISGVQVTFVPQRAVQKGHNLFCRPLELHANGQKHAVVSTCRTPQGRWVETQI